MVRVAAERQVLRAIADHDGEWYWYQVDRAISNDASGCVGPFFAEIEALPPRGSLRYASLLAYLAGYGIGSQMLGEPLSPSRVKPNKALQRTAGALRFFRVQCPSGPRRR